MKKIVGTIVAASLALSAFAAEPAANFVMTDFTGSAEFGWKGDFTGDTAQMGMYNDSSATLKFGFVDGGDKATAGSGIWGELKIKADGTSVENGKINLGGKDAASGDYSYVTNPDKDDNGNYKDDIYLKVPSLFPAPAVDTAKIHFVEGDFHAALNIMKPGLKYGAFNAPSATGVTVGAAEIGNEDHMKAGFGLEFGMKDLFDANFKLMDNGAKFDKEKVDYSADTGKRLGLAVDAAIKAVPNLDLFLAGTFNFSKNVKYTGFGVNAGYKFDINDTLYVKPGLAFTTGKKEADEEATNSLMAGVLVGYGAADQEPGFAYIDDNTTEGVSLGFGMNLKNTMELKVGAYDQSLAGILGVDDMLSLKTGVLFTMTNTKGLDDKTTTTNVFAIGERARFDFSPVYAELGADLRITAVTDKAALTDYKVNVKLGSEEVIANTDVFLSYAFGAGQKADGKKAVNDATKAENLLTIGAKIHF